MEESGVLCISGGSSEKGTTLHIRPVGILYISSPRKKEVECFQ
jgi:hypothetical protein